MPIFNSVYKSFEQGWQPGSNTVAYYPLESDANDYLGNYNGTIDGTALTYGTVGGSIKNSAFFAATRMTTSLTTMPKTINFWMYKPSSSSDPKIGDWKQLLGFANTDGPALVCRCTSMNDNTNGSVFAQTSSSSYCQVAYGNLLDKWLNICITTDGSTRKLYINASEEKSDSGGFGAAQTGFWVGNAPNRSLGGYYDRWGYFSKIILETPEWTQTEITNYFNQTKGDYGIS